MSKADEMFEKLGYREKVETIENGKLTMTEYKQDNKYSISFKEITKEIFLDGFRAIELKELQAINEKCKELRWLDE